MMQQRRRSRLGDNGRGEPEAGRERGRRDAARGGMGGKAEGSVIDRVMFGITSFERPERLRALVDSIQAYYPGAAIVVADNSEQPPALPADVELLRLPYDCGLSAARNALIDRLDRPMMLLLEEDFEFTAETRLEALLDVLDSDNEIGFVAGSLYQGGRKLRYAAALRRFRDVLYANPSREDARVTPAGTVYRPCDMGLNFGLFRRAMLDEHRWPDEVKLGEHAIYFEAVRQAGQWRVAQCDQVRAMHRRDGRSEAYVRARGRAADMLREALAARGIHSIRVHPELTHGEPLTPSAAAAQDDGAALRLALSGRGEGAAGAFQRPNVVILGVGHSGTSILAKMLFAAGWAAGDADEEFGESVSVREVNQVFLRSNQFCTRSALRALFRPGPWAIKDPRFALTLPRWLHCFAQLDRPPTLVWIRRDVDATVGSYVRRGVLTIERAQQVVQHRLEAAAAGFDAWPWAKVAVDYERLAEALALFDGRRAATKHAFTGPVEQRA